MKFSPNTMRLAALLVLMSVMCPMASAWIDIFDEIYSRPGRFSTSKTQGKCGIRPYDDLNRAGRRLGRDNPDLPNSFTDFLNVLRQQKSPSSRIVGGHKAARGEFPWQGRMQALDHNGNVDHTYVCGATIISEFWLISAAHCFTFHGYTFRVIVGDYSKNEKDNGEQEFEVQVHIHEGYTGYNHDHDNDIALVKILPKSDGRGIQFNDYVQPACLPDSTTQYTEGTKCLISGWGMLKFNGSQPDVLQGATVPLVSQRKCEQQYRGFKITRRMVCAGYDKGGVDTCANDSGGPLVSDIGGIYTLLGATSFGQKCAEPNFPGVYARVSQFLRWIKSTIESNSENRNERQMPTKP